MALVLQAVVVHNAPTEQIARIRAMAYAPEAAQASVRATSQSYRFEVRPTGEFQPKSWFSSRVTKDITLVQGILKEKTL